MIPWKSLVRSCLFLTRAKIPIHFLSPPHPSSDLKGLVAPVQPYSFNFIPKKSCPGFSIFDTDEIPVNSFYNSPSPFRAKLPRSHPIVSRSSTLSLTFLYKSIHSNRRSQLRPRMDIMNVNSVSLGIVYFWHGQKSLFYNFLQPAPLPPTHGLDHPGPIL